MNLIQRISSETPGLTLRVAVQRWLSRRPGGLAHVARALEMDPRDVQSWLNDDKTRLKVVASAEVLEKMTRQPQRKRMGQPPKELDQDKVARIKTIGADEYANRVLAERKRSLGLTP